MDFEDVFAEIKSKAAVIGHFNTVEDLKPFFELVFLRGEASGLAIGRRIMEEEFDRMEEVILEKT